MITIYLLENCKYCKNIYSYIKKNPSRHICVIYLSRNDLEEIKKTKEYSLLNEFPVAFMGNPNKKGMPRKNAKSFSGTKEITKLLSYNFTKNNFGNLKGNILNFNYPEGNIGNIHQRNNHTCFNSNSCHVMDRPYGQCDNQYLLKNSQPITSNPHRSHIPVQFGTTPGTKEWKHERDTKSYVPEKMIHSQKQNKLVNIPINYKDNKLNKTNCNYGKYIESPINNTAPFLTYAAGSNTNSRKTGEPYFPVQNPQQIQNSPDAYLNTNLKQYLQGTDLNLMKNGMSKYGDVLVQTAFNSSQGNSGVAQLWKPRQFIDNGNSYGKSKPKKNNLLKPKKNNLPKPKKTNLPKPKKNNTLTSPLGIEINFGN